MPDEIKKTGLFDGLLKFFSKLLETLFDGGNGVVDEKIESQEFDAGAMRAIAFANSFKGRAELGGEDRGSIIDEVGGIQGRGWCGAFLNHVMDETFGIGLFDQKDHLMARSYMREGKEYGVFHPAESSYMPKKCDVIVMSRGGNATSGHVGMVTKVEGDMVTWIAGNDGDAVKTHTFNIHRPPKNLLGFTDTKSLAIAKGVVSSDDLPGMPYLAGNGIQKSAKRQV